MTMLEASIAGMNCNFAIQPNQVWRAPEKSKNSNVISIKLIVANTIRNFLNILQCLRHSATLQSK